MQYLHGTLCSRTRSWQHNGYHRNHHECHDNLNCILDKRHHITNLQCSGINLMGADPYDQYRGAVHNQHDQRHQACHGTCGEQIGFQNITVCFRKFLTLTFLIIEGTDDRHSIQNFTNDGIQLVHQLLQHLELRHNKGECHHHDTQNEHNDKCDDPCHGYIGIYNLDHSTDSYDRSIDDNTQNHYQRHLNLLDIIGGTCNQRIRGEFIKFSTGEVFNLIENILAQVSGYTCRDTRCQKADSNCRSRRAKRYRQHHKPVLEQIGILYGIHINTDGLVFISHIGCIGSICGFRPHGIGHLIHFLFHIHQLL